MIPRSIRWRLPLSYIAIALLTVCALGAVLLTTLRDYYAQQELNYLNGNAHEISRGLERLIANGVPLKIIYSQLENFSFLAQVKVRLLDTDHQVLVETASPHDYLVSLDFGEDGRPIFVSRAPSEMAGVSVFNVQVSPAPEATAEPPIGPIQQAAVPPAEGENGIRETHSPILSLLASRTPFGIALNGEQTFTGMTSDQRVTVPIVDRENTTLGYLELSEGPAYGTEIILSVAQALIFAGAAAALLAAGVGWYMSRRMSAPLLTLTETTARMAGGDLAARVGLTGQDEFGLLAHSFNHMANQVESTVTALRRFVADAAHELHTPLTALSADLELAATDSDATRQLGFIQRARQQLKRLETLTTDLLDLSRIETHSMPDRRETFDVGQLARETSELYASRAEQVGLNFNMDVPQNPVYIHANESQFRRALGNLLDNALKFTPENGSVSLGIRREEQQAEIWVAVTGIGIPAD
ncbi:MAG: HAMP domain-containing histidine kinase, partial [Anaerolineae bacterium]|nr:HAMP domain-containing histidine kinase [Anaerolineae bacterium]